ncbi:MAG: response regulator [Anaerolineae bacterium]|nr:response regulator [Anaerolineae bacterium]
MTTNRTQEQAVSTSRHAAVIVSAQLHGVPSSTTNPMSGIYLHALQYVMEKYGALVFNVGDSQLDAAFNVPNEIPVPGYLAVTSALEMHQVVSGLRREFQQTDVTVSIGISKGLVTVIRQKDNRLAIEGDSVGVAATLREHRGPEGLAVAANVYEDIGLMASNFKHVEQTSLSLPGSDKPLSVYWLNANEWHPGTTRSLMSVIPRLETGSQVLIAEDDPALRSLFARVLKNAGLNVKIAASGNEVIDYLEQQFPTVLVLDLGIPGVSGQEIVQYVHAHKPADRRIVIVVVTGNHLASQNEALMESIDLLLVKPVSPRDLVTFVKRFTN